MVAYSNRESGAAFAENALSRISLPDAARAAGACCVGRPCLQASFLVIARSDIVADAAPDQIIERALMTFP